MTAQETITERDLAARFFDQLGLETLADKIGYTSDEGPQCPWLSRSERDVMHHILLNLPEPGAATIDNRVDLLDPNDPLPPPQEGMLRLLRPHDAEPTGCILYALANLSGTMLFEPPASGHRGRGGRSSPLDLRACLRHIGVAIERTAERVGADKPDTAWCVAALLIIRRSHEPLAMYLSEQRNKGKFRILGHMRWKRAAETHAKWLAARKATRAEVAPIAPGVYSTKTVALIAMEVRQLLRERRKR